MTEPDASPAAATGRRGAPPLPILVSAAAWVLTGVALVLAWSSTGSDATVDPETLGTIRNQVGDAGADRSGPVPPVLLLVLAVVLVALAGVLVAGRRLGRYPAVLAGVVSVVLLALAARWETVPAMVLLVVGTVPLLLPGSLRHLR